MLVASYYFYMSWNAKYAVLIAFSTIIDFSAARFMQYASKNLKKLLLAISIMANLGFLFIFKYYNFFRDELINNFSGAGFESMLPWLWFALPVGISFYTFQTISYTIDVFRGTINAEKHLGKFALFVSFFPQLVAGPIEKYQHLGPQLKKHFDFKHHNIISGLRLILYGLFIKMCVADNISLIVDEAYANSADASSLQLWIAVLLYSFQIYADFHGYSTIAIGSAQLFGIKLMDNFKAPYLATSITEFWKRWHISLTSWFRDYLYIPLGGNRVSKYRWVLNILIVFIISGFWHGANFTFIVWGLIHGLFYLLEWIFSNFFKIKAKEQSSITQILLGIKTFVICSLAWVFFRSNSISEALLITKKLFSFSKGLLIFESYYYALPIVLLIFLILEVTLKGKRINIWLQDKSNLLRWSIYSILFFAVLVWSGVASHSFIYFQF